MKPAADKREGDGASPAGVWPIRRVLYRPDRGPPPATAFELQPISRDDGWCDAPKDPAYNQPGPSALPRQRRAHVEGDGVYDIVVVLGHNDDPVVPGMGSCIFLHLSQPDYSPTQGCVAVREGRPGGAAGDGEPGDAVEIRA